MTITNELKNLNVIKNGHERKNSKNNKFQQ